MIEVSILLIPPLFANTYTAIFCCVMKEEILHSNVSLVETLLFCIFNSYQRRRISSLSFLILVIKWRNKNVVYSKRVFLEMGNLLLYTIFMLSNRRNLYMLLISNFYWILFLALSLKFFGSRWSLKDSNFERILEKKNQCNCRKYIDRITTISCLTKFVLFQMKSFLFSY